MSFTILDSISGVSQVFSALGAGSGMPTGKTALGIHLHAGWDSIQLVPPADLRGFVRVSYDPVWDMVMLSTGEAGDGGLNIINNLLYYGVFAHAFFPAETLSPAGSGLATSAFMAAWYNPMSGSTMGWTYDYTTGTLYACKQDRVLVEPRTSEKFTADLGQQPFYTLTNYIENYWLYRPGKALGGADLDQGTLTTEQSVHDRMVRDATKLAAGQSIPIKSGVGKYLVRPVIMNDVYVFAFGGALTQTILSVVEAGTYRWLGTRPVDVSRILDLVPLSVDRFALIALDTEHDGVPIIVTYRWDRGNQRLEIDSATNLATDYRFSWPEHIGHFAYDSTRGTMIVLSPDQSTFERHVMSELCHPTAATALSPPVPISPLHAGQQTTFAVYARNSLDNIAAPRTTVAYSGISAGDTTLQTTEFRTTATQGIGTFKVGWSSAACGVSAILTAALSSFSVAVSSTTDYGTAYGVEAMSLTTTSSIFAVSGTLSASVSATSLTTSAIILAKKPTLTQDAGGTPWELDHPLSGTVTAPLVMTINPQQVVNLSDQVLKRPLHAAKRTLGGTAITSFTGYEPDVEVKFVWMGGGQRIAMDRAFFASLYEYFANPPAYANGQFIEIAPKSITTTVYKAVFVSLDVGGNDGISLDTLYNQGDGWVHETCTATFRIVGEV